MDFGAPTELPTSGLLGHRPSWRMLEPTQVCETCGRQFRSMRNFESHRQEMGHFQPMLGKSLAPLPQTATLSSTGSDSRSTDAASDISLGSAASAQRHGLAKFACCLCPKQYTRAHNLRAHLRSHGDERPFVCRVCDRGFARHHDREAHERLHAGWPEFVCSFRGVDGILRGCGRRFARKQNLRRHLASGRHQRCHESRSPPRQTAIDITFASPMNLEMRSPENKDSTGSAKFDSARISHHHPSPPMRQGDVPVTAATTSKQKSSRRSLPDALCELSEPADASLERSSFGFTSNNYLDELAAAGLLTDSGSVKDLPTIPSPYKESSNGNDSSSSPDSYTLRQCEICGKIFTGKDSYAKYNLRRHVKESHGEAQPPVVCNFEGCTYSSKRNSNVIKHLQNIHGIFE